jgi:hypothetical protein
VVPSHLAPVGGRAGPCRNPAYRITVDEANSFS